MSDITHRTLSAHISSLASKEYSSRELTLAYLDSIEHQNKELNSYITVIPEIALAAADESDKRRTAGELLSVLDGIPFAQKDNIASKGVRTTCGSRMLEDYIPPYDAYVTTLLKSGGAVMLGKTNLDEFAMGVSTETSYFGAALNPVDVSRVSGGSSGGAAAAVAAGLAAFALGSDTGGSVRQPAAFCGLVGVRPTYGTLSRRGLVSFAPSMDQVGLLCRDVRDCALLNTFLAKHDKYDETSISHPSPDLSGELSLPMRGIKIAVLPNELVLGVSDSVKNALHNTIGIYESLGAEIAEVSLTHAKDAYAAYYTVGCAEASSNLARFDGVRYGHRAKDYDNLNSLYCTSRAEGFGKEVKRRLLFGMLALSGEYADDFYARALKLRAVITEELNAVLDSFDILLLPTTPTEAYKIGESRKIGFEAGIDDIFCTLASLSGLPALSVPAKVSSPLPIGIQLVGKRFSEPLLYRAAYALEQFEGGK